MLLMNSEHWKWGEGRGGAGQKVDAFLFCYVGDRVGFLL